MIIHDCEQGTDTWFQLRLGKLTASNATAIGNNGKGLNTLCIKKAAERITGMTEDSFLNEDIARGHELEGTAREAYELETGNLVREVGFIELDDYSGCSPDGLVGDEGGIELKCMNDKNFLSFALSEEIYPEHYWQMQMCMYVSERKWWDYGVYNEHFPKSILIKRVKKNDGYFEDIEKGIKSGKLLIEDFIKKFENIKSVFEEE